MSVRDVNVERWQYSTWNEKAKRWEFNYNRDHIDRSSIPYNSGGFTGTLTLVPNTNVRTDTAYKPGGAGYPGETNVTNVIVWTGTFTGTVSRPATDTRTYRYQGYVSRPASDTRVWRYRGTVNRPESDTRTYDYFYQYKVEVEYREQ